MLRAKKERDIERKEERKENSRREEEQGIECQRRDVCLPEALDAISRQTEAERETKAEG